MNAAEAAAAVGVHERTVRRAIKDGRVPATKYGRGYSLELEDVARVFGPKDPATTLTYQQALADALAALRNYGRVDEAEAIERRYGLEFEEPRPAVRVAPPKDDYAKQLAWLERMERAEREVFPDSRPRGDVWVDVQPATLSFG